MRAVNFPTGDTSQGRDLPVRPSFACALIVVTTRRNIAAGTTWTSSRRIKPHSRDVRNSIIFFDSCERLCVFATMEYVDTTIPLSPANYELVIHGIRPQKEEGELTFSFDSAVKTAICLSVTFDHCINCCRHCITDTLHAAVSNGHDSEEHGTYEEVQRTRHDFLIVQAAVIPTSVLPAPQGSTMIPDRARLQSVSARGIRSICYRTYPLPNILLRLVS